jgi:Enoyl-CoA hydratase/carnithine racemase
VYKILTERYHPLITGIRRMPKPVIAGVNGPAAGIGLSLALACDLVVAAESAYFSLAFVNIGLVPDGGSSLFVPSRVGFARAAELAMLGERLDARTALGWGLINRVWPDEEYQAQALALLDRMAAAPPGPTPGPSASSTSGCMSTWTPSSSSRRASRRRWPPPATSPRDWRPSPRSGRRGSAGPEPPAPARSWTRLSSSGSTGPKRPGSPPRWPRGSAMSGWPPTPSRTRSSRPSSTGRDAPPPNPGGWLATTARRKAIDRLRRARAGQEKLALLAATATGICQETETADDELLGMVFACCHPALPRESQIALTLRAVCGLTTAEIAAAFLAAEPAMTQRLLRARKALRAAGRDMRFPTPTSSRTGWPRCWPWCTWSSTRATWPARAGSPPAATWPPRR